MLGILAKYTGGRSGGAGQGANLLDSMAGMYNRMQRKVSSSNKQLQILTE